MAPPLGYKRSPAAVAAVKAGIERAKLDPLKWGGDRRPGRAAIARSAHFMASLPTPANEDFSPEIQRVLDRIEKRGRVRFDAAPRKLRKESAL